MSNSFNPVALEIVAVGSQKCSISQPLRLRACPTISFRITNPSRVSAHGFLVLSETAEVLYKTTNLYHPEGERCILWNDPTLNILWPPGPIGTPNVSAKDALGTLFTAADLPPAE